MNASKLIERPAQQSIRLATAAVIGAACFWGLGNSLNKLIDLSGLSVAFYRMWLGVPVMWLVLVVSGSRFRWQILRSNWLAGVLFVGQAALFFTALRYTSVANASVIAATQPLLVMGIARYRLGEHSAPTDIGIALIAIAGIAVMVAGSTNSAVWSPKGDLLAAGTVLLGSFYIVISKQARVHFTAPEYMMGVTLAGALFISPIALFGASDVATPTLMDFVWIASVVIVGGTLGHLLFSWGLGVLPAGRASQITLGLPVSGSIAAFFILDESIGGVQLLGIAIAVSALGIVVSRATQS